VGAFHLAQINTSIVLCYLLNAKKDRTTFVSTCVTKWKASNKKIEIEIKVAVHTISLSADLNRS